LGEVDAFEVEDCEVVLSAGYAVLGVGEAKGGGAVVEPEGGIDIVVCACVEFVAGGESSWCCWWQLHL
jgi:hypothetical protein